MSKKSNFVFIVSAFMIMVAPPCRTEAHTSSCGEYSISSLGPDEGYQFTLTIFRNDTELLREEDGGYFFSSSEEDPGTFCADLTGDGIRDVAVFAYSGGAHCCWRVSIYSLGDEFRQIAALNTGHSAAQFKDLDGDAVPEILVRDWSFAYWHASFADSPAPEIVLRYRNGSYEPAPDLMAKPVEEIQTFSQGRVFNSEDCSSQMAWSKDGQCVGADVWTRMLDLIYAGHEREAFEYLNTAGNISETAAASFMKDFEEQLEKSAYAVYLRKTGNAER